MIRSTGRILCMQKFAKGNTHTHTHTHTHIQPTASTAMTLTSGTHTNDTVHNQSTLKVYPRGSWHHPHTATNAIHSPTKSIHSLGQSKEWHLGKGLAGHKLGGCGRKWATNQIAVWSGLIKSNGEDYGNQECDHRSVSWLASSAVTVTTLWICIWVLCVWWLRWAYSAAHRPKYGYSSTTSVVWGFMMKLKSCSLGRPGPTFSTLHQNKQEDLVSEFSFETNMGCFELLMLTLSIRFVPLWSLQWLYFKKPY